MRLIAVYETELIATALALLESNCLEVVLIPSGVSRDDYAMIRAVQSQNTEWYRAFCREHPSNRKDAMRWSKFKTKIKRQDTVRGLRELLAGRRQSHYAQSLHAFLTRNAALNIWQ